MLSSDGGAVFDFEADKNFLGRVQRYVSIPRNQELKWRKRWLISNFLTRVGRNLLGDGESHGE
jgi:hypothetical protein